MFALCLGTIQSCTGGKNSEKLHNMDISWILHLPNILHYFETASVRGYVSGGKNCLGLFDSLKRRFWSLGTSSNQRTTRENVLWTFAKCLKFRPFHVLLSTHCAWWCGTKVKNISCQPPTRVQISLSDTSRTCLTTFQNIVPGKCLQKMVRRRCILKIAKNLPLP